MEHSGEDPDEYRVKFLDIRVKPPGGRKNQKRKPVDEVRVCEHKGCDLPGDCKAPKQTPEAIKNKHKSDEDYHWFCQRHAAEFNKSYNFFDNMTEAEFAAFQQSEAYGHKKTWKFGAGPMGGAKSSQAHDPKRWRGRHFFDENGEQVRPEAAKPGRTRLQLKALDELNLPHDADAAAVRQTYSRLIKEFHPDSNGGDRSMEHRLNAVIRAFKTLKAAGLA